MKKPEEENTSIAKALSEFGQIIVDDREEMKLAVAEDRREMRLGFEILTKSVNKLILSDAKARSERGYEREQRERMEGNQKEQGVEIKDQGLELKHISDNQLLQSGKIEVLEKKQDIKDKIRIGIYIAVGTAAILAFFNINSPIGKNNMYETPKPQNNQPVRQHLAPSPTNTGK